jgi:hypothetical protein
MYVGGLKQNNKTRRRAGFRRCSQVECWSEEHDLCGLVDTRTDLWYHMTPKRTSQAARGAGCAAAQLVCVLRVVVLPFLVGQSTAWTFSINASWGWLVAWSPEGCTLGEERWPGSPCPLGMGGMGSRRVKCKPPRQALTGLCRKAGWLCLCSRCELDWLE